MDDSRERAPTADPVTDGPADVYVHQPVVARVLGPLRAAPWQPSSDQLALAGAVVGLTAAVVVVLAPEHSPDWLLAAWLLFAFSVAARLRRVLAPRAAQPDVALQGGMLDLLVGGVFWIAFAGRTAPTSVLGGFLACAGVLSTLVHAGLYEHIRLRFATVTEPPPEAAPGPEPTAAQPYPRRGVWAAAGAACVAFAQGFCEVLFSDLSRLALGVEPGAPAPAVDRALGRRLLATPMHMASYLSLSTHLFVLYASTALAAVHLRLPFWIAFFTVVVALNVWTLFVVVAWRRAEAILARLAARG